jgi:26S proteasome regulatory subunit N5
MKRLVELLDLSAQEAEDYVSALVVNKTIFARIDRLKGVITFVARKDQQEILNDWSHNISSLLNLVVKTNHLIAKEEMVHSITKTVN